MKLLSMSAAILSSLMLCAPSENAAAKAGPALTPPPDMNRPPRVAAPPPTIAGPPRHHRRAHPFAPGFIGFVGVAPADSQLVEVERHIPVAMTPPRPRDCIQPILLRLDGRSPGAGGKLPRVRYGGPPCE